MTVTIGRRELLVVLGGAAAAWPLAARAQQPAMPVIGWLGSESREAEDLMIVPFRQGLNEAGYVEGQNLAIEYRLAEGQYHRLPARLPIWSGVRRQPARQQRWRPRQRPQPFRSFLPPLSIRLQLAWSPTSTGQRATQPA